MNLLHPLCYHAMEAEEATEGRSLSGPPCHGLTENPEKNNKAHM